MGLIDFGGQLQPFHRDPQIFDASGFIRCSFSHLHGGDGLVPERFGVCYASRKFLVHHSQIPISLQYSDVECSPVTKHKHLGEKLN
jgi:hypothetical protein